jgi:hypothetical protein
MHRSIWVLLVCGCSVACHIEEFDDEEDKEELCGCDRGPRGPGSRDDGTGGEPGEPGEPASGGATEPESGGGDGGAASPEPPPAPCGQEADCAPGFNCELARGECVPTDAETCGELATEAACDERPDCKLVYAGVNCSCGPDCQCVGGEPGCICAAFEFFRCEPAG